MRKIRKSIGFMMMVLGISFTYHTKAEAATTGTDQGYTYSVEDGSTEATITGYTGGEEKITIPSTLGVYQVTEIGMDAFIDNKTIISVTIPGFIKNIGRCAFSNATNLQEVKIENGCESILANAFELCTGLEKIIIPTSVENLEYINSGNEIFDGINLKKLKVYLAPESAAQTYFDTYEDDIQYYYFEEYNPSSLEFTNPILTINVGDTYTFTSDDFNVSPSTAYFTMPTEFTKTGDSSIAYVSNGVLKAQGEGTITVNATIADKHLETDITTTIPLTVNVVESRKKVESVTLNVEDVVEMYVGDTLQLEATVSPNDAVYTDSWGTTNNDVATVSETGLITAVSSGTAQVGYDTRSVFGNVYDNNGKYILVIISERPIQAVESVTFPVGDKTTMYVGDTLQLIPTILPSNAVYTGSWYLNSFGKEGVASINSNGLVTALKEGYVKIEYSTLTNGSNGASGILDLYIEQKPSTTPTNPTTPTTPTTPTNPTVPETPTVQVGKITLNASKISLQKGKTIKTLSLKVNQLEGDRIVSVTSSNKKVLKASLKGQTISLKGLKTNSKYITVTIKMKSGATATCKVKVVDSEVTTKKLTLSNKKLTIKKGKSDKITVTRNPISATDKITYKSSNTKIATIDKNGKIKAKKKGKVTITVTSASGKKATCKVTVK